MESYLDIRVQNNIGQNNIEMDKVVCIKKGKTIRGIGDCYGKEIRRIVVKGQN